MNILAIESSSDICGAALFRDGELADIAESQGQHIHSEKLAQFTQDLLKRNYVQANDLQAVAISEGPGSFTGLRIGMSFAKGLALSTDLPMLAVPTLETLKLQIPDEPDPIIASYSHKKLVFWQRFSGHEAQGSPQLETLDAFRTEPIYGYRCEVLCEDFHPLTLSAKWVGQLALQRYDSYLVADMNALRPNYLSEFQVKMPK